MQRIKGERPEEHLGHNLLILDSDGAEIKDKEPHIAKDGGWRNNQSNKAKVAWMLQSL